MNNTSCEGLHTAAFGITWQALVFGYAGLWADSNRLRCDPKLPEWIRGMRFRAYHKGKPYTIFIKRGEEAIVSDLIET